LRLIEGFPFSDGIARAKTLLGLNENELSATQLSNYGENNQCKFILPEIQLHPGACQTQQGLSTASGKPIAISKDALARAKNLLGDLTLENEIILNKESLDREITPKSFEEDFHESGIMCEPVNAAPHQIEKDFRRGKDNAFASKRKPRKISSVAQFKRPRSSRLDLNFLTSIGIWISSTSLSIIVLNIADIQWF
jgi:BRCA2 repeat